MQLVQCLKLEKHDDSVLFRFLLRRGLKSPYVIGHYLYWYVKSEMHVKQYNKRFGLLLELYVVHCGEHREHLIQQQYVVRNLEAVTNSVLKISKKDSKKRNEKLRQALAKCRWPKEFETCISPKHHCSGIVIEKCKVMDSKQAPLWIEFKNTDAPKVRSTRDKLLNLSMAGNHKIIFKVGDDLRQDQITLQFLRIVNRVMCNNGNDVRMNPYIVVGTGDEVGMVEIVPNSDTVARCQWAGGGPYDKNPLFDFILANALEQYEQQFVKAKAVEDIVDHNIDNFLRSCAGYVVTTYVMGIGDRHPSNIMMQKDGHLFHIDFGHFLGNFKTKKIVGIKFKRERSPLVFTPQMLHVLNPLKDEFDKEHNHNIEAFMQYANETFQVSTINHMYSAPCLWSEAYIYIYSACLSFYIYIVYITIY